MSEPATGVDALAAEVSAPRLMATVQALCRIGEKVSGTDEERRACDHLTGQLTDYGVAWQLHRFEALISHPIRTGLQVCSGEPVAIAAVGVAFARDTGPAGIEAELAWAGSGREADYAGLDVRGKIVLIGTLPEYGVCATARRAGALALVGASSGPQRHKTTCSPIWGSPASEDERRQIPDLAAASVSQPDLELLRARVGQQPTRVRLVAQVDTRWRSIRLPVAEIPGSEPEFLLAGSHYCTWFDGATDNVAANAILLELARSFARARPRFGLRLAWWPGHSQGRYAGSAWYADQFWQELHDRCIGYLNVDINGSRGAVNKALRNVTAEAERYAAAAIAREAGDERTQGTERMLKRPDRHADRKRPHRASDQSFLGIGVSSLQVSSFLREDDPDRIPGGGLPRWWHAQEDAAERVDAEVLAEDARIHVRLVHGLVHADKLPFELEAIASDFEASLRELQEAAPELALLGELHTRVQAFRAAARRFSAASETLTSPQYNRTVLATLRQLTPVLYTARSGFEPDRATSLRLLPGLSAALSLCGRSREEQLQAGIGLRRAGNRIAHALEGAIAILQSPNSTHAP